MSRNAVTLVVLAAFPVVCGLVGCSRGVELQAALEYSPEDGSVRAVVVRNESDHVIESATVQMDFHLRNGDLLTKKAQVARLSKESPWRYELDQPVEDVARIDLAVSGRDGGGKMSFPVPSKQDAVASGRSSSDDRRARTAASTGAANLPTGDPQEFARIVGEWDAFAEGGYLEIRASGEFGWIAGGTEISGTCSLQDSLLRLKGSQIKERDKEAERLPANNKVLEFKVSTLNPLTVEFQGATMKFRGVTSGDRKRANMATEIKPAPGGEPSLNLLRTYTAKLHEGWREIHLYHEFTKGSLIETVKSGRCYWIVMMADSGHRQRVPARYGTEEFFAVLYPSTVQSWDNGQAEAFWRSLKSATFWIEYAESENADGFRVSPVVEISKPDL